MPLIAPLSSEDVSPEIRPLLNEIGEAFGFIPKLFSIMAHHPALLQANWDKVKAVMMGGVLQRPVKEAIALLISRDNGCRYCIEAHTNALLAQGFDNDTIAMIEADQMDRAGFNPREAALIRFARAAGHDANQIPESVRHALRQQHPTTVEIVEALGTMELFTAFNRFLDSLNIEQESA